MASNTFSHELDVTGLRFRWKKTARRALADIAAKKPITGIRIVREPDNDYDDNALMVCLPERIQEGKQLGYLRSTAAEILSPKIDAGEIAVHKAVLTELHEDGDWNEGTLLVTFRKQPAKPVSKRKTAKS